MVKRNDKRKQLIITEPTFERFISYGEYKENNEGILIKIMDLADKAKRFTTNYRNRGNK